MNTILIVNPGSTSTKIAIFEDNLECYATTISHSQEELAQFATIAGQQDHRFHCIFDHLKETPFDLSKMIAVIGIGGLLKNVESGVYAINEEMLKDLKNAKYGEHAANLGAMICSQISQVLQIPAFIADPITVDEMQEVARISGHPLLPRYGRTHTLNHKSIAMTVSESLGKPYEEASLIIAHLGGGVSIAAHKGGKIIDATSSRGEGAFSLDRSGALNSWELAKLCFSGKYSKKEVLKMLNGNGGVVAYLNTRDFREVERLKNEGDLCAKNVFDGLAYQVSKEIASMAAVLEGHVDAMVLTGGMAYSKELVACIEKRIGFIGNLLLYPGEKEMHSLALYLNKVLNKEINSKVYESEEN